MFSSSHLRTLQEGAVDAYGPLTREPVEPKRGLAVVLRRTQAAMWGAAKKLANLEDRLSEAKKAAAESDLSEEEAKRRKTDVEVCMRRAAHQAAILDFKERRAHVVCNALQTRTLTHMRGNPDRVEDIEWVVRRNADVLDAARVRANCSGASEAFRRLRDRLAPRLAKIMHKYSYLPLEEREQRRDEGIYRACCRWQHDHPSRAMLGTIAFTWAMRCLQPRTIADKPMGYAEDGRWIRTASLDAISERREDPNSAWTPYIRKASDAKNGAVESITATDRLDKEQKARCADVQSVLGDLSGEDRLLCSVWMGTSRLSDVATATGSTVHQLKKRMRALRRILQEELVAYAG